MLLVLFKKFVGRKQTGAQPIQSTTNHVEEQVLRIQQGDQALLNQFIADYKPFIAKVTSRFSKRYIDPARDDEFSISLQAFHEAIMSFSSESGSSFFNFAETVIRRRLIDYVRKEQRHTGQIPYSVFDTEDEEDNVLNPVETKQAVDQYTEEQSALTRREEILELDQALAEFGISFADLVDGSPKHADSRAMLVTIGRHLGESEELLQLLKTKKVLPIKQLLEDVNVSRKTLERNRKFLIAIALIHSGSYPYLREYIKSDEPEIISRGVGMHA